MTPRQKLESMLAASLPLELRSGLRVKEDPRRIGFLVSLEGFIPFESLNEVMPPGEFYNDESRVS